MTDGGTWQPPRPDDEASAPTGLTPPTPIAPVEPDRPRRGRGTVVAAVVGAVAIVGAGVFAVSRVTGGDAAGGAETPEAAGLALLTALENEDLLGAVDVLLPGERDTLRKPMVELVSELQRLEVLSGGADLAAVSGVDIEFTDESVEAASTNVDDIVNLTISGSGTGSIDGEALPIGDLLLDLTDVSPPDLTMQPSDPSAFSLPMTAVEEGGRWYVSGGYTVAEMARREMPDAPDIPGEGIVAVGGDSPEDAMDNLLDGVEALDLEGIIGALNPDEFRALQRYAPLFLADGQAALDDAQGLITIDDPEYVVSGSGDRRSLTFSYLRFGVDIEGERGTFTLQDGCWTIEAPDLALNTCDPASLPPVEGGVPPELLEDLRTSFEETLAGFEDPGFAVQRVDGKWFVSPMATLLDQLLAVARALDRTDIEEFQTSLQELIEQFETGLVPGQTEIIEDDTLPEDGAWSSVPGDTSLDPAENCWGESDVMSAAACFQTLVDDGTIDQFVVPFYLLAPECGLGEVGWDGEYYTLPDDDFVAIVEEAAPCFQEKVAAGEIDEFALPPELLRPQCLEGRNPYNTTDETYLEAYDACAYG